jgi:hypothetical protein
VRTTRRHIPEDGILHSHRHENLKSYIRYLGLCFFGLFYDDMPDAQGAQPESQDMAIIIISGPEIRKS